MINPAEEKLRRALSLQEAVIECTADGLLVVDRAGKIVSFNRRFVTMWSLPVEVMAARDDDKAIAHVLDQLKQPERFVAGIRKLYSKPMEESIDILNFKDGRVFERLSRPQLLDGDPVGRVWSFRDITEHRRVENRLRRSREQLRNLSARREEDLEEERLRISREVHDGLGQAMTAIRLDARWCEKMLLDEPVSTVSESILDRIRAILGLTDSTTEMIRRISAELRPGILDDLGLGAAIETDVVDFELRTGIKTSIVMDGEIEAVPIEKSLAVFRIFREAMTNIARHAKATQAQVWLSADIGLLTLIVADNGIGFSLSRELAAHSLGLLGMKERALQFGGTLVIDGAEPTGTRVTLVLPENVS